MKQEQQVCTLEQAKRLKELGVTQNTLFQCLDYGDYYLYEATQNGVVFHEHGVRNPLRTSDYQGVYALFTVAELGVMLPTGHDTMRLTEMGGEIWHGYDDDGNDCPLTEYYEVYRTEAEARAAMLIYLLENNLTTPEEVNNRLNNQ